MEILRHGNTDKLSGKKYFKCNFCDAIWSAIKSEYKYSSQYNEDRYFCTCPMPNCKGTGYEIDKSTALQHSDYYFYQE